MKRLQLDVSDEDFELLWHAGVRAGFLRENPRLAWTEKEKRECIMTLIKGHVEDVTGNERHHR